MKVNNNQTLPQNSHLKAEHFSSTNKDSISVNFMKKGYDIGHSTVHGLCGNKLSKFSEISLMFTSKENEKIPIFDISKTKIKNHKMTRVFRVEGFQTPLRKDNDTNDCLCKKWY